MLPTSVLLALLCLAASGGSASSASRAEVREVRLGDGVSTWPLPWNVARVNTSLSEGQIVGGSDAKSKEFPHQVSMQVTLASSLLVDAVPQHICGGSLVGSRWALTAAHCVWGVPDNTLRVEVLLGTTDLAAEGSGSPGGQRVLVSRMLAHARYEHYLNGGVNPFDVALLKLARAAVLNDYVKLALLPAPGSVPQGTGTLSGWGSTSEDPYNPVYPNQLQAAEFPIVDFQTCYDFLEKENLARNPLADTNLCVGPLDKKGLSSCSGDSGGPLTQMKNGDAVVVGVASWGLTACASKPFPSVFTRTSAFIEWLAAVSKEY